MSVTFFILTLLLLGKNIDKSMENLKKLSYGKMGNKSISTCFAALLQNELKSHDAEYEGNFITINNFSKLLQQANLL